MLIYVSALISLLLTLIIGVPYLQFLKNNLYGQFIREEAPSSHQVKSGTPTMGGVIIVIPAMLGIILSLIMDQKTTISAFITLLVFGLFTLIGFKDDISKILKKQNKGIGAKHKLLLQILIASIPAVYMYLTNNISSVSVFDIFTLNLGVFYPLFAIFIIVGASNAVNLTDGLDGLAAGTMTLSMIAFTIFSFITGRTDLAIVSAGIAGSCLGFLYYNRHPAQIFMGDTGSLALGGILGTLAVITSNEFWLLPIGIIFVIETLSVILQVISFKTTGKRIFKMSPVHHHFELSGWSEKKVVRTFWFVALIFIIAACILKYNIIAGI